MADQINGGCFGDFADVSLRIYSNSSFHPSAEIKKIVTMWKNLGTDKGKIGHYLNFSSRYFSASHVYELVPRIIYIICIITGEISVKIAHCFVFGKLCGAPRLRPAAREAFSVSSGSRESAPGCSGWC